MKTLEKLLKHPKLSWIWALTFIAVIGAWMLTGEVRGNRPGGHVEESLSEVSDKNTARAKNAKARENRQPFRVQFQDFSPQKRRPQLILRGRTETDNRVDLMAETAGLIRKVNFVRGNRVAKGSPICELETGARKATLLEAKAELKQAEADYIAQKSLAKRGHSAELNVVRQLAKRDSAKAKVERAQLDLDRTIIRAPFDGTIETLPAKAGALLNIGGTCARIVSLDPMLVIGAVAEKDVGKLHPDQVATAKLITGQTVKGKVRFIASLAEETTRTFRIEVEIPNPERRLKSGVTTDILISLPEEQAYLLPPRILGLNDSGEIGVRLIGANNKVRFHPIEILSEETKGIWARGLKGNVRLITIGGDFVDNGETVTPVPADQKDIPNS